MREKIPRFGCVREVFAEAVGRGQKDGGVVFVFLFASEGELSQRRDRLLFSDRKKGRGVVPMVL